MHMRIHQPRHQKGAALHRYASLGQSRSMVTSNNFGDAPVPYDERRRPVFVMVPLAVKPTLDDHGEFGSGAHFQAL